MATQPADTRKRLHRALYQNSADRRLRERMYVAICDRRRWPTVRAVLDAVNRHVGSDLTYEEFRQSGRMNLATRAWSYLLSLAKQDRVARVEALIQATRERDVRRKTPTR
jgi:hypothetical protein